MPCMIAFTFLPKHDPTTTPQQVGDHSMCEPKPAILNYHHTELIKCRLYSKTKDGTKPYGKSTLNKQKTD